MRTSVKVGIAALAAAVIVVGYFVSTRIDRESAADAADSAPDTDQARTDTVTVPAPQVSTEYHTLPETPAELVSPPPATSTSSKSN